VSPTSASAGWLLALDTATNTIVLAAGRTDGKILAEDAFEGRYRHSQELLPGVVRLIDAAGLGLGELRGVIVGTGPGAFTGLRVGIATAKTLAHELGRPVVGIGTAEALLAGVAGAEVLWLPSGPRDRVAVVPGGMPVVVRAGEPGPLAGGVTPASAGARIELAVDLDGRAPEAALLLGREALARMPETLLQLGAARLAIGDVDDPEQLVPRYASPPRGAPLESTGEVAWSRDPR
jgi:tRNA threonylcarbamoyl adenosine modification protein YeaZ